MSEQRNPVVASTATRSQHPYSSIAVSPDRRNAIVAGKDTLRVISLTPQGLREIRSLRISQHFQKVVAPTTRSKSQSRTRDSFKANSTTSNVVITDVAWSLPQNRDDADSSIVAAAGSNGVVVVWNAKKAFLNPLAASAIGPPPDAVLSQHSRAVNRLDWHSNKDKPGLLLTSSQDATVKLWERRSSSISDNNNNVQSNQNNNIISWFGKQSHSSLMKKNSSISSWHCLATFEPKAEAVRDIRWSPFHDDIFAMVTVTGSLLIYNINNPATPCVRIQAHDGEATTLDWHPSKPGTIATGGAGDRCVKVWVLTLTNPTYNRRSNNSKNLKSKQEQNEEPNHYEDGCSSSSRIIGTSVEPSISTNNNKTGTTTTKIISSGLLVNSGRKGKTKPTHILYIAASVTRVIWRPPARGLRVGIKNHESMLAVATSPIKGDHAGGNGLLSLWSYHRPYMALSVVEGHKEGAVTDFMWIDIPTDEKTILRSGSREKKVTQQETTSSSSLELPSSIRTRMRHPIFGVDSNIRHAHDSSSSIGTPVMGSARRKGRRSSTSGNFPSSFTPQSFVSVARGREVVDTDDGSMSSSRGERKVDNKSIIEKRSDSLAGTWQHVLSVGKDGRCILQSFVRGDRPISRVSPSCFAMSNLSPFQTGYGSLQIFSVHHNVPHGRLDDYALTGLRQDLAISKAPGVFREPTISSSRGDGLQQEKQTITSEQKIPNFSPKLVYNVIDQGDLDSKSKPKTPRDSITIAPEVVHLSRFADSYKLYPDDKYPSRSLICLHNATVADNLYCGSLARMWRMIAAMLKGSGLDYLPPIGSKATNALQFALVPCVKKLLEERANAGDVQTCVALCEILQVLQGDGDEVSTCIPGMPRSLVREWYLSYIDLLQQMCLFSHATSIIKNCKDPIVGALNRKSVTIDESCQHCRKPLLFGDATRDQARAASTTMTRRSCGSCRRRLGFCFICHEPVKGLFVWCPGCGHGGCLNHALEWFGGIDGKSIREECPTGCGHKCNLSQHLTLFPMPKADPMPRCQPVFEA